MGKFPLLHVNTELNWLLPYIQTFYSNGSGLSHNEHAPICKGHGITEGWVDHKEKKEGEIMCYDLYSQQNSTRLNTSPTWGGHNFWKIAPSSFHHCKICAKNSFSAPLYD